MHLTHLIIATIFTVAMMKITTAVLLAITIIAVLAKVAHIYAIVLPIVVGIWWFLVLNQNNTDDDET